MALTAFIAYVIANWQGIMAAAVAIGGALHLILGVVNSFIPASKRPGWLETLIDKLGALPKPGMKGAMGVYSPPLMSSKPKDDGSDPDPTLPLPPAAVALLCLFAFLPSCGYCMLPANKETARCKAQAVAVDCAAPEIEKLVLDMLPAIGSALLSDNFSSILADLEAKLYNAGTRDVWGVITCAINKIESRPTASFNVSRKVVSRGEMWKDSHPAKVKH